MRDEEERILAALKPRLKLAFYLLLYTLQRPSDVLAMHRDRVTERDGRLFIALKQAKTGILVDVPVHANLAPLLRGRLVENFGGSLLAACRT
jgi:integrase